MAPAEQDEPVLTTGQHGGVCRSHPVARDAVASPAPRDLAALRGRCGTIASRGLHPHDLPSSDRHPAGRRVGEPIGTARLNHHDS